jgi:hypothetical protein
MRLSKPDFTLLAGCTGALVFGILLGGFLASRTLFNTGYIRGKRYVIEALPTQTLVDIEYKDPFSDSARARFIEYGPGQRVPANPTLLSLFLNEKYRSTPISHEAYITELIELDSSGGAQILRRWQDVPGFKADQIDPDLKAIEDPFTPHAVGGGYIVYTYQRDGNVKRYRFIRRGSTLFCDSHGSVMSTLGNYLRRM